MPEQTDQSRELDQLRDAFASFNSVSHALQSSYRDLQAQVEGLQRQLAAARRERADETRRLTAVLEALPGGVVMVDDAGIVRRINTAAVELLGDPLKEMEWGAVCHRAFQPGAGERGDLTLSDGRRVNLAHKDMTPEPGRVLLLTDVTENRKFQELLDRHRRLAAMGEMAAALAHQIRTPLSAALLYTSNAARPDLTSDHRGDLLDKATRCLSDLEQLIGDMLQFSRGASHTHDALSVVDLFSAARITLQPMLRDGQSLDISMPESSIGVRGNREALVGAILNLVTNALQSAGDEAAVAIDARCTGTQVEIRVSDNGPGIDAERAGKIFDPFYTSRPDGTGLGLAVVKSVAESHGGDIRLAAPGERGATFVLHLPAAVTSENDQPRVADAPRATTEFTEGAAA